MLFLFLIILFLSQAWAQIVSINEFLITDSLGLHTDVEISVSHRKGNVNSEGYDTTLRVRYIQPRWDSFVMATYNLSFTNSVKTNSYHFLHLREIYSITPKISVEAIYQISRSPFQNISSRTLFGGGLRYNFPDPMPFLGISTSGSAGITLLHERETSYISRTSLESIILNIYSSLFAQLTDTISQSLSFYYQPNTRNFSEYRSTLSSTSSFKINEYLSLNINFSWDYDSFPQPDTRRHDTSLITSLVISF